MINIRRNCFETNSSSMHSLVVSKIIKPYTEDELALGYSTWEKERNKDFDLWHWIEPSDMTYERSPFQVLRTPLDKLRYYAAYTLGTYRKPKKADIKRIQDFIMKQTGITNRKKIILCKDEREFYHYKGFKKHITYGAVYSNDSGEDPMHYVEAHNISMEDLILNPKYTIIVDGDESQLFKSLFDAGIINAEDLEDISSGADYWNDSDIHVSEHSLYNSSKEEIEAHIKESMHPLTKTITFSFEFSDDEDKSGTDRDTVTEFNNDTKLIKELIDYTRTLCPNIKSVFCAYTYSSEDKITMNDLKDLDLSIFDTIRIDNHDEESDN